MIIRRRSSKRRKIIGWVVILLILALGMYSMVDQFKRNTLLANQADLISPIPVVSAEESVAEMEKAVGESQTLEKVVQGALEGSKGTYGVVIKNLKTGEHYEFNEGQIFDAASLYKLWVMAVIYEQVKDGTLKEDQVLSDSVQGLNDKFNIDSETAERTEGSVSYSITNALEKMITISDNYAALLLSAKVKMTTVSNFVKKEGFTDSATGTANSLPSTSADDTALFFEKLYNGQLIDAEYSQKMLELLKRQRLNKKIPRDLPENLPIAHKTGELGTVTHDAGIVYSQNGDYIIVVMSDSGSPKGAEERISSISKAVYDYFQQ